MRTELANKVVSVETEKRLSLKEKMSYGFGDFGNGFMFDLGQIYLLKYFTDVAGIPAAMAGGIFLVSKLFAAITDPIVGSSIDYRKNIGKRGKFALSINRQHRACGAYCSYFSVSQCINDRKTDICICILYDLGHRLFVCEYSVRLIRGSDDSKF